MRVRYLLTRRWLGGLALLAAALLVVATALAFGTTVGSAGGQAELAPLAAVVVAVAAIVAFGWRRSRAQRTPYW